MPSPRAAMIACGELAERLAANPATPEEILEVTDVVLHGIVNDLEAVSRYLRRFAEGGLRREEIAANRSESRVAFDAAARMNAEESRRAHEATASERRHEADRLTVIEAMERAQGNTERAQAELSAIDARRARNRERTREWRARRAREAQEAGARELALAADQERERQAMAEDDANRARREAEARRVREWRARRRAEEAAAAAEREGR